MTIPEAAQSAYEQSTLYRRPWETLTAEERQNWLRTVAHLATPPGQRRGRVTALIVKSGKEQAA